MLNIPGSTYFERIRSYCLLIFSLNCGSKVPHEVLLPAIRGSSHRWLLYQSNRDPGVHMQGRLQGGGKVCLNR